MDPRNLPRVKIPDDLTIDEIKCIDTDELLVMSKRMRRAVIDDDR